MTEHQNGFSKWLRAMVLACFPLVLLAVGGLFLMWRDFAVAQDDIVDLEDQGIEHDEILDDIPAMKRDIEHIAGSIDDISTTLKAMNETIQADNIEDAKHHHTHPRSTRNP